MTKQNSPSDFVFGRTKVRGVFAGEGNPHRDGIFVEHIRRTGKMNPGRWLRLTDGKGDFWEFEMNAVVIWEDGETEESVAERSETLFRQLYVERFGRFPERVST